MPHAFADTDLSSLDPLTLVALEEYARKLHQLQMIQAQKEQDALAREMRECPEVNGFVLQRRVHADAFHDWGLKLGSYDAWTDKGFLKYFDKIAPETRVKYKRKAQVGWTESLPEEVPIIVSGGGEKRFVKKYA